MREATHARIDVRDPADVGAVRREVGRMASETGGSLEGVGRAQLVATELATNVLHHAGGDGSVLSRPLAGRRVEIIAVDRGPGLGTGSAPAGLGCGLAAVQRAAALFDVYSLAGAGTVVTAVVDLGAGGPAVPRQWGGVSVAIAGECGDGWAAAEVDGGVVLILVDGLGHGPAASAAASAAIDVFAVDPLDLGGFVRRANRALRATRGAAVAVCHLDAAAGQVRFVGVGNVSGRLFTGDEDHGFVCRNGTVGARNDPPRWAIDVHPWTPGATVVLWTDGLVSRLATSATPGLLEHDPAVVAGVLYRDFGRARDDAAVVVARHPGLAA